MKIKHFIAAFIVVFTINNGLAQNKKFKDAHSSILQHRKFI